MNCMWAGQTVMTVVRRPTWCDYEVPGMILLQASYLYTYSLPRGVTFEVLPLSSCVLSPTMLPLLETFLELLLLNIFQCREILLNVFNILKSSSLWGRLYFWKQPGAIRSQIRGTGWVFPFSNRFLGQKLLDSALWAGAVSWWRIQSLGQSSGLFIRTASRNCYSISIYKLGWLFGLEEWIQSEQYTWYGTKWWALSSFVISTRELSWVVGISVVSIENFVVCFRDHSENTMFQLKW
jgi:hypothetical protein